MCRDVGPRCVYGRTPSCPHPSPVDCAPEALQDMQPALHRAAARWQLPRVCGMASALFRVPTEPACTPTHPPHPAARSTHIHSTHARSSHSSKHTHTLTHSTHARWNVCAGRQAGRPRAPLAFNIVHGVAVCREWLRYVGRTCVSRSAWSNAAPCPPGTQSRL